MPAGVPGLEFPPPFDPLPPQAEQKARAPRSSRQQSVRSQRAARRGRRKMPSSPARTREPPVRQGTEPGWAAALLGAVVGMVKVVEAGPPDGVTVEGEKLHDAPLGTPEQAKLVEPE